jgi:bacterioferritin
MGQAGGGHVQRIREIRERARKQISSGTITPDYTLDRDKAVAVLNEALATEIVCVLRYKFHYFMATGIHSQAVKEEFNEHAAEEQEHADRIAQRITQLGGEPDFAPSGLADRSASEYVAGRSLVQMIEDNLIAERIAIDTYHESIAFVGEKDPTTRRMLEEILAKEEEHATELADLLSALDPTRPPVPPEAEPPREA